MYCDVRALVAQAILHLGLYYNSLFGHFLLKPEHAAALFIVFLLSGFGVMRIRVMAVKELDNNLL